MYTEDVMEMKWKEIFKMEARMSFARILSRLEMIHRRYRLLWFTMYLKMYRVNDTTKRLLSTVTLKKKKTRILNHGKFLIVQEIFFFKF